MNFTIEDIRKALDSISTDIGINGALIEDLLVGKSGKIPCTIHLGWDLQIAHACDRSWGAFNNTLLRHIRSLEVGGVDVSSILMAAQLEDHHWKWLNKSLHYRGDSYKWFFLVAEKYPQAACMIYHPKKSVASTGDVFYVEYIATAPWNRENVLAERVFKGVGPKLLSHVINYAQEALGLHPGFSLHSLPKATQFYKERLGMTAFPQFDKDGMQFFEWVPPNSKEENYAES